MTKVRVHEYAKKVNKSSKEVIEELKKLNVTVSNHMSTLESDAVTKLDTVFKGSNSAPRHTEVRQEKKQAGPSGQRTQSNDQSNRPNRPANSSANRPSNGQGNRPQNGSANRPSNGQGNRPQNGSANRPQNGQGNRPSNGSASRPANGSSNRPSNNNTANRPNSSSNEQRSTSQNSGEKFKNAKGNQNRNMSQNNNNNSNNNNNKKGGFNNNQRKKPGIHGGKRRHPKTHQPTIPQAPKELPEKITFYESLSVAELAKKLHREPSEIIKKLFMLGVMATINQELDKDAIELICADYGVEVEEEVRIDKTDLDVYFEQAEVVEEEQSVRPPVVTIMGHVDHGKTTLLDSIRNTKVTAGEAGGITQHIGAYQVNIDGKKITFLDTPGHAAFTTMRARGASITDLAIIVVAADDGVMPQTVEAINHAKAAEVPIIVAVNKMDKPSANPDRVMQELTEHGLVPEDWGGETIFVPISALKGEGIDTLLEMILLVSEVAELKANPGRSAIGSVIEAQLDKGRGSVATLLVQDGTLRVGDPIVVGHAYGRVRAMVNDLGRRVKEAGPSTPVEITGINEVPQAGDRFVVFEDEKTARQVGESRAMTAIQANRSEKQRVTLDNLFEQMSHGEVKELNLIVKADVQGTVEAMAASLMKIDVEGVNVKIIHTGAGAITESDISLAAASNAIVIGFNVRPDVNAKRAADEEGVDIRLHRIIYKVIEEIEAAMKGMLDPEFEEKIIGQAEVRQTIKVSKVGTIAGSYVTEGKITRDSGVRIIREGIVIFEGDLDTLKRFKDDAKEVAKGYECGITIKNFNDIKEGDIIEAFVMEEIKR
ncbi:translation initiation factor IF-2 [Ureibacillus chungkukjangi]|uniref:translation initiation factor IF-2 n=1 Tax=Ureibacillus chungkukjangi TaxID=1202712 RepID=UPI00204162A3|nr:translation initiation factor IF-2 [Ureibacillus chungkukjangi]MCM3386794.1 translation initiation factor IF-2 [Ureibacillus chungkukjangi]